MNLRKSLFYFIDRIRGGAVRKGLADLRNNISSPHKPQSAQLEKILLHATKTTSHYKLVNNFSELSDFPILNKSLIKQDFKRFISESYKTKLKKLRQVSTSGSYGTPITFYSNDEKRNRVVAELYHYGSLSGFDIGVKHAHLLSKRKPYLYQLLQNQVMITVDKLDDEWCANTLEKIRKEEVDLLIGYASAITRLARYLLQRKSTFRMSGIITISEVLTAEMRQDIIDAFKCVPGNRYATMEFGVLGNQDSSGDFFELNQLNYVIEILSMHKDVPAKIGELGRIVVTDLYNYAMPLIRYETGDLARPLEIDNGLVTKIDSVEGRQVATIRDVGGNYISPFMISVTFRNSPEIIQYQFSQEGSNIYQLKLVAKNEVDEQLIKESLKSILGTTAHIEFTYVSDIPALPSGKRPYIVQNFYSEA